jgi:hypothetical protein
LNNTDEQRYPWTMASDDPEDRHVRDEALSQMIGIADDLVDLLTRVQTDWCQIARQAHALADHASRKCDCLNDDLTRK